MIQSESTQMSDTLIVSPMAAQLYQDEFMPPTIAISQIASYSAANTKTKQAVSQFPNLFAPLIAG